MEEFSALDLYGCAEADRRRFDFAVTLTRDWSRPLAGQTLWNHSAGVDKDIRMLMTDRESEIKAYVIRDNVKNHALLAEVIQDFKRTELGRDLFKLKTLWVPDGFDADDELQRATMRDVLRSSVVEDILFNVVFGRLSAQDVAVFLSASGTVGLTFALFLYIAREGMIGNIAEPKSALGVSAGPIRERLLVLQAAGFVGAPNGRPGVSLINELTAKGRVFLDVVARLSTELRSVSISEEFHYILEKLGCAPPSAAMPVETPLYLVPSFNRLTAQMQAVRLGWGLDPEQIAAHRRL